jgi:4-hydroxybenzoate polyprenyltransferase
MIGKYLSLVKFSHTIFAMPFALMGYFIGINTPGFGFEWRILLLVILCMVFARSAAMGFNRYVDRNIDAKNQRTAIREIPSGIIKPSNALVFVIISSLAFIVCSGFINPLCLYLSPIALFIVLVYSYTKRFTAFCHLVLGLGLAIAPVGAYIAVTGQFNILTVIIGFAVLFWVSGFDIIYALQDVDFDKTHHLKSIPSLVGEEYALKVSAMLHIFTAIMLIISAILLQHQFSSQLFLMGLGVILFIGMLIYQHSLVKPKDLRRVNRAFFTSNGIASMVLGLLVILDFYI